MASEADKQVRRGFHLPCPACNEVGYIRVSVDNLESFDCPDCGHEFTAADVRTLIDAWGPFLAWVATAPELESRDDD